MALTRTHTLEVNPENAITESSVGADLARRVAEADAIAADDAIEAGVLVRLRRDDEHIDVVNLEQYRADPLAPRGGAALNHPGAFAAYVNRLADNRTTVWADRAAARMTAVFNDHGGALAGGWRDHTATLTVERDPDWLIWRDRDGKLGTQESFAEFIEEHYTAIVAPPAAEMLEVASTFQARRSSSYERATRLQSGDVQLRWVDETTATAGAKGHIEVPQQFTVALAPFVGLGEVEIVARLRYRIRDGVLGIGFKLHRPDVVERDAFDRLVDQVRSGLDAAPVYHGSAPRPLR